MHMFCDACRTQNKAENNKSENKSFAAFFYAICHDSARSLFRFKTDNKTFIGPRQTNSSNIGILIKPRFGRAELEHAARI